MATNSVPAPKLGMTIDKTPDITVVHCTGRIVSDTTELLKKTVKPLFEESKTLVLDLTHVNHIDSSELGFDRGAVHFGEFGKLPAQTGQLESAREGTVQYDEVERGAGPIVHRQTLGFLTSARIAGKTPANVLSQSIRMS